MSDSDIVKEFLAESYENLDRLDRELVELEKEPANREALASVFRTIHTIKGTCGFLGFEKLEKVAHVGENLLSRLRDGVLKLNPEITTALLQMVDAVRQMLSEIQATGQDGNEEYKELQSTLARLQSGEAAAPTGANPPAKKEESLKGAKKIAPPVAPSQVSEAKPPEVKTDPQKHQPMAGRIGGMLVARGILSPEDLAFALRLQERGDKRRLGEIIVALALAKQEDIASVTKAQDQEKSPDLTKASHTAAAEPSTATPAPPRGVPETTAPLQKAEPRETTPEAAAPAATPETSRGAAGPSENRARETAAETIRVGVNLLDKLMTLVGELVLARNQLLQFSNTTQSAGIQAVSQRMNLITTELQEEVMKTRMQPIGNIWNQFPRTVRDVAVGCGKEVRIEMEGKETELDKTIIEAIKDPLTHLVRNSVDHGIELPPERTKAGKDPEGRLMLRAYHEGGHVNIEINDDGAGINRERVKQKAVERGLVTQEQAAQLTEREIFNLILLPGFSTAEKVTNVSGRGVGMDVVKTNVEKIGGTVNIQSTPGKGTTVRVKIPLTLAIVPALIVTCGGDRYAIPQVSLLELVRLEDKQTVTGIELVHGAPVHRLRGRLLPLVYLRRELGIPATAGKKGAADGTVNIVVLQADGRPFGLIVDEINDTEEIVVKPLRKQLKGIKTFAGASIMGDGKVALILDVLGLAQRANVLDEGRGRGKPEEEVKLEAEAKDEKRTYLLFMGPDQARMAMPLDTLARLEELPASQVEKSGIQWVAQYRGKILPLINLNYALEERRRERRHPPLVAEGQENAPLEVLVCNHQGNSVGLVVERIVDIVEDSAKVKYASSRAGVLCSAVIQGQVTELIDIPMVLQAARMDLIDPEHVEVPH